jgi:hypothetical protein
MDDMLGLGELPPAVPELSEGARTALAEAATNQRRGKLEALVAKRR